VAPGLAVAEHLHGDPRGHPLQQQGRGRVPGVMQPGRANLSLAEQRVPCPAVLPGVDGPTVGLREHQVGVLPERAGCQALRGLQSPMLTQGLDELRGEHDGTSTDPTLGLDEDEALSCLALERPPHGERPLCQPEVRHRPTASTDREGGEEIATSRTQVYGLIRSGDLPAIRIGTDRGQ
jgi:hypothetical protein